MEKGKLYITKRFIDNLAVGKQYCHKKSFVTENFVLWAVFPFLAFSIEITIFEAKEREEDKRSASGKLTMRDALPAFIGPYFSSPSLFCTVRVEA